MLEEVCKEQLSQEWFEARWGKVTGTSLKNAIDTAAKQSTLMMQVVAEKMSVLEIIELNTPAVNRGLDLEAVALDQVCRKTKIKFETTGFLASKAIPEFGFSPDGIFKKDGKIIGGVEIKCPSQKKHIEYMLGDAVPKDYKGQVLSPFVASDDVEWWYFASFDDRFYQRELFLHKVERKDIEDQIEPARKKLKHLIEMIETTYKKLSYGD